IGVVCLLIGILATLVATFPSPRAPEVVVCPAPPPCEACPACPAPTGGGKAAPPPHTIVVTRPQRKDLQPSQLPAEVRDPDAHRDRLRAWFESHSKSLTSCFKEEDPRRRVLIEMKLEADGTVVAATLLGATDLPKTTAQCVESGVMAMRAPKEELRGRET